MVEMKVIPNLYHTQHSYGSLDEMATKGIKADVFTYNSLIGGFCSAGRWDDGAQLLRDMITNPDTITCTSLIYGFCNEKRLDEANQMMELMVTKGCDPNIVTFNILINGYCKAKRVDEGMRLF
ncbi:hypothetical protein Bca52824_077743 [Brassica carinata]|uniref:Pentatricopeptide repeat-containing protein n=1 Tax=Brassica carinata TaxID=52824 RepID=A0A8X7TYH4_BRACI|nr:hypothetical protein Bca52824_077743 [Brassica carinata]